MNSSTTGSDKSDKIRAIIEASQKHFGLYGIEKATMREIADDLNISKASLYYYFPDKESLYKAVVEKEQDEFMASMSDRISNIDEPEKLLLEYSSSRLSYFRNLLNLSRLRLETYSGMKPVLREISISFKEKEKEVIKEILNRGVTRNIFFLNDADSVANLFLDLLRGLRILLITDKNTLFIDQDEYEILHDKTIEFTRLFIRGLKNKL